MKKSAIRLLTLAIYATALVAVPVVTPAGAAADNSQETKKKQKTSPKSSRIEAPRTSTQYPPNMSDDPGRKVSW